MTLHFRKHFQKTLGYSKLSENTFDSPLGYSKKLTFPYVLHGFFDIRIFTRIAFQILCFVSCDPLSVCFSLLDPSFGPPEALFSLSDLSLDAPGTLQSLPWVSRGSLFGSMAAPLTVLGRSRACFRLLAKTHFSLCFTRFFRHSHGRSNRLPDWLFRLSLTFRKNLLGYSTRSKNLSKNCSVTEIFRKHFKKTVRLP